MALKRFGGGVGRGAAPPLLANNMIYMTPASVDDLTKQWWGNVGIMESNEMI